MLVSILLCDMEMQSTLTVFDSRVQGHLVTFLKCHFGLNTLKLKTKRLVTITYSILLITGTSINCQMSSKFGYIVHFILELLALSA